MNACIINLNIAITAIFEQVYNFSFMRSYENLENIAVPISIELNFHSWWRLEPADF